MLSYDSYCETCTKNFQVSTVSIDVSVKIAIFIAMYIFNDGFFTTLHIMNTICIQIASSAMTYCHNQNKNCLHQHMSDDIKIRIALWEEIYWQTPCSSTRKVSFISSKLLINSNFLKFHVFLVKKLNFKQGFFKHCFTISHIFRKNYFVYLNKIFRHCNVYKWLQMELTICNTFWLIHFFCPLKD